MQFHVLTRCNQLASVRLECRRQKKIANINQPTNIKCKANNFGMEYPVETERIKTAIHRHSDVCLLKKRALFKCRWEVSFSAR